jgi:hypothetical protein
MKQFLTALATLLILVPASIYIAALLWNVTLVPAVTWANPVGFWQMAGIMLLLWILWPGTKPKISIKNEE